MADNNVKSSPTYIHGVGSSQALDTAGEIVDLAGLDTSSLNGAPFNYEHKSDVPAQICGKILENKKIFSEDDCENDHHKYFWDKCKTPFLYVMGRLFDDKKDSAREVAALFIDDAEHPNEPPMIGFSVEGSKISKNGIIVDKSIARKITLTTTPANKTCIAEIVAAPSEKPDSDSLFRSESSISIDLVKSELKKAQVPGSKYPSKAEAPKRTAPTSSVPKWGPIEGKKHDLGQKIGETKSGKAVMSHAKPYHYKGLSPQEHQEMANIHYAHAEKGKGIPGANHFETAKSHMSLAGKQERQQQTVAAQRQKALNRPDINTKRLGKKEKSLNKALTAGSGMAAPGNLIGGSALAKENLEKAKIDSGKDAPTKMTARSNRKNEIPENWTLPTRARAYIKEGDVGRAKLHHEQSLARMKDMPKPKLGKSQTLNKAQVPGSKYPSKAANPTGMKMETATTPKFGPMTPKAPKISGSITKSEKNKWLARAEEEYAKWEKREDFEAFMTKSMPHLSKGEIKAIGQVICLDKSLKKEKVLQKLMAGDNISSYIDKTKVG